MKTLDAKKRRAWGTAQSIINRYGDVNPNDIPLGMLRKNARKKCRKSADIARVMDQITLIRQKYR